MTEITKHKEIRMFSGWVFYDGACPMCVRLAGGFSAVLGGRGFKLVALQTPWVRARLGLGAQDGLDEMFVLTLAGDVLGGADAVVHLAGRIWWAWPVSVAATMPGGTGVLRWGYRWVARHRGCVGGRCSVGPDRAVMKRASHDAEC